MAGLWSGAKSLNANRSFTTSSVITTLDAYLSFPCTKRCPTPSISSSDLIISSDINFSNNDEHQGEYVFNNKKEFVNTLKPIIQQELIN